MLPQPSSLPPSLRSSVRPTASRLRRAVIGVLAALLISGLSPLSPASAAPTGFITDDPPPPDVGFAYSYQFVATGSPAPIYSLASGRLPSGLQLSPDGLLSGLATRVGTYTFRIAATRGGDPDALSAVHTFEVESTLGPVRAFFTSGDGEAARVGEAFPSSVGALLFEKYGNLIDHRNQVDVNIVEGFPERATFFDQSNSVLAGGSSVSSGGPLIARTQPGVVKVAVPGGVATLYVLPADAPPVDVQTVISAPSVVKARRPVKVKITVTNTGARTTTVITPVRLPDGWTVLSAPGTTDRYRSALAYPAITLAAGASHTYAVTLFSPGNARLPGWVSATAGSSQYDPNTVNNSATTTIRVRR